MKLPHLIAILAAAGVLILMVGGAALGVYTWRQSRNEMRAEMDLRVAVPPVDGIDRESGLQELVIEISPEGRFIVDGAVITEQEILRKLAILVEQNEDQPVRLHSGGHVSWQTMVDAIDVVEKTDVWNISFSTQKPSPEASPAPSPE